MNGIPVIDMAGLRSADANERRRVAQQVGAACRDVGFFALTGHGVPPALMAGAFAASRRFFEQPLAAKRALAIEAHGHNRGYVGLGVESLDETKPGDVKEAFNLIWTDGSTRPSNVWPALDGWRDTAQAYFDAALAAGRLLHTAFAIDLGLPERFFDDKIDCPQATLRFLHYPQAATTLEAGTLGAGIHTDYGNVTLLATDGVAGLQVQGRHGAWLDAPHVEGGFVCNIGDCLMRWTDDVYVSTPHRVLRPQAERYSIALFVDPNPQALVEAIPSCVAPGESPRYAPITAGAYLQSRFDSTYAGKGG